jgi:chitinase
VTGVSPVGPSSSSVIVGTGIGGFRPGRPSSTLAFRPSTSASAAHTVATGAAGTTNSSPAPSSTDEAVSPVYTGAASKAVTGVFGGLFAVALSMFMIL